MLWKTKSAFDPLRLRKASPPGVLAGHFLHIIILLNSQSAAPNPFEDREVRPRRTVSGENEKKKNLPQLSELPKPRLYHVHRAAKKHNSDFTERILTAEGNPAVLLAGVPHSHTA